MRVVSAVALSLLLVTAFTASVEDARAEDIVRHVSGDIPKQPPRAWSEETLERVGKFPVQDDGRVKPLSTWASYTLLRFHGKQTLYLEDKSKIKPLPWLLDTVFYPEIAMHYPVFLVEDRRAIEAIRLEEMRESYWRGLLQNARSAEEKQILEAAFEKARKNAKRKRDHYSYWELFPALENLFSRGREYGKIESKDRSTTQEQVVNLMANVRDYEALLNTATFARRPAPVPEDPEVKRIFGDRVAVRMSDVLANAEPIFELYGKRTAGINDVSELSPEGLALVSFLRAFNDVTSMSSSLAFLPPEEGAEWLTPADLWRRAEDGKPIDTAHIEWIQSLEAMAGAPEDETTFQHALGELQSGVVERAKSRGEYEKIDLEVFYYKLDAFFYAKWLLVLAFMLLAVTWLVPRSKKLVWGVWGLVGAAFLLMTVGIVLRCVIRERPPISTLYETIVFIAASGVLVSLIIEAINRRRIALAIAPVIGALSLWLAELHLQLDAKDTMPSLQAVLDTNFWLSTHVTCIMFGYMAGLLAGILGHVYVLGKTFGIKHDEPEAYRVVAKMVYGMVCFGLLFSLVGTILGGIWANDSWGRFWGWDPKENGALMIVIWNLVILHARMGGYIKAFGVSMAAIVGGVIVSWSWWGVNLLNVGLHSYGFTAGVWNLLLNFWILESAVLLTGIFWWFMVQRPGMKTSAPPPPPPPPPAEA